MDTPDITSETGIPILTDLTDQINDAIMDWFPNTTSEERDECAFFIAHDVLHLQHVEGQLWAAFIERPL